MTRVLIGTTLTLVGLLAAAGWKLSALEEDLTRAEEARAELTETLETTEEQRQEARERAEREARALSEARERERDMAEKVREAEQRAADLESEAREQGAEPVDPWDCAVTPVPEDWIPERWQP